MDSAIIVGILSLIGTIIGCVMTSNKAVYRIEQLEKRVEKHNSVVERMAIVENTIKSHQHQLDELKEEMER